MVSYIVNNCLELLVSNGGIEILSFSNLKKNSSNQWLLYFYDEQVLEIQKKSSKRRIFNFWYQFSPEGEFQYPISIPNFNTLFQYHPVTKEKFRETNIEFIFCAILTEIIVVLLNISWNWRILTEFLFVHWFGGKFAILVSKIPYSFYILDYKIMTHTLS